MSTSTSSRGLYNDGRSPESTTSEDADRRANPLGAYITTAGALITLVAVWLPWVTLGKGDEGASTISGYEADSIIAYIGLLAATLALALLYATSRADRRQHRGLTLASMAAGLAWVLVLLGRVGARPAATSPTRWTPGCASSVSEPPPPPTRATGRRWLHVETMGRPILVGSAAVSVGAAPACFANASERSRLLHGVSAPAPCSRAAPRGAGPADNGSIAWGRRHTTA